VLVFTFSEDVQSRLDGAIKAASDFTVPMTAIADYLRTAAVDRFDDETAPDGSLWEPSDRALEDGGLTLTKSGMLRQSITADSDNRSAVAGTNLIYAAIHNFGGTILARPGSALRTPFGPRASVSMPKREFLGFAPEDVTEIEALLMDHLEQGFAA